VGERALLLADDIGVFLAVARSLGRRGIEVHVADAATDDPALASRYIAGCHSLPSYASGPCAWVDALCGLADRLGCRLILPCSDDGLLLLRHHADPLGRNRLGLANEEALSAFTDKAATRALANRLGVPVAEGMGTEAGADRLEAKLGLPLVLKPRTSYRIGDRRTKEPAIVVRSRSELDDALARLDEGSLAEAYFEGEGVGVSVLADGGEIRLVWQHRRLRTWSETGGSSLRIGEPVDPELRAHVDALAAATRLTGVAMFEFRVDRRARTHILLETNCRFWGSLPLAIAGGVDFPAAFWDLLTGRQVPLPKRVSTGQVKCNVAAEADRLSAQAKAARSLWDRLRAAVGAAAFLATLLFPRRFDSWAEDDPAPFTLARKELLGRMAGAVSKRLPLRPALRPSEKNLRTAD
jgi:predicted ATP-grasp superfamily ATP-dependent carboligase